MYTHQSGKETSIQAKLNTPESEPTTLIARLGHLPYWDVTIVTAESWLSGVTEVTPKYGRWPKKRKHMHTHNKQML
jgi:hypothetical protein